ncbi:MAG: FtsQ-type POTRA domain-containing protein, partial [Actinomycetia bacterium]|nr:FtsQ-type POTRA domain-containing protein [Actinomycetes bacterium]
MDNNFFHKSRKMKNSAKANKQGGIFTRVTRIIAISVILVSLYVTVTRMYVFMKSRQFYKIRSIELIGSTMFTKDEIINLSGIDPDSSIFQLDVNEIKESLKLHPKIRNVKVMRELPGTLLISIVEKVPVAIISCPSGIFSMDSESYILAKDNFIENFDLPIITGFDFKNLFPGVEIKDAKLKNILKVLY